MNKKEITNISFCKLRKMRKHPRKEMESSKNYPCGEGLNRVKLQEVKTNMIGRMFKEKDTWPKKGESENTKRRKSNHNNKITHFQKDQT